MDSQHSTQNGSILTISKLWKVHIYIVIPRVTSKTNAKKYSLRLIDELKLDFKNSINLKK